MGTEESLKQSLRSANKFRCSLCLRNFQNMPALKSHQNTVHSRALSKKQNAKPAHKPKITLQKVIKVQKVVNIAKMPQRKTSTRKAQTTPILEEKEKIKNEDSITDIPEVKKKEAKVTEAHKTEDIKSLDLEYDENIMKIKNTRFQCPKCMKVYPMLFPCRKHIEKEHCGPGGVPSDQLNPIRVESNTVYNERKSLSERYSCNYLCSGCKVNFLTLQLFRNHVAQMHSEGMEGMFFPTVDEFNDWKNMMEKQTQGEYATLTKWEENKDVYHCMKHVVLPQQYMNKGTECMCPSMISTQTFSKGIQVHFCKSHYAHRSKDYNLGKKFSKYSLTSLMNQKKENTGELQDSHRQLYDRFKTLMEFIVMDAARMNEAGLKDLIGKALEMSDLLANCGEGADTNGNISLNKTLTDDQIMKELEPEIEQKNLECNEIFGAKKRKSNIENLAEKKRRQLLQETLSPQRFSKKPILLRRREPKIVNTFSLADTNSAFDELLKSKDNFNTESQPSNQNCEVKSVEISKSVESDKITELGNASQSPILNITVRKNDQTPVPSNKKRKQIVKTRIDQFKQSSPQKVNSLLSMDLKSEVKKFNKSDVNVKDFMYEVIEQENDCNILVLKF